MTQEMFEDILREAVKKLRFDLKEKADLVEIMAKNIREKTILINSLADDIVELKKALEQRRING